MSKIKLICPECSCDKFRIEAVDYTDALNFLMSEKHVCVCCGWSDKPDDPKEMQRRIQVLLTLSAFKDQDLQRKYKHDLVDWKGFEKVIIVD